MPKLSTVIAASAVALGLSLSAAFAAPQIKSIQLDPQARFLDNQSRVQFETALKREFINSTDGNNLNVRVLDFDVAQPGRFFLWFGPSQATVVVTLTNSAGSPVFEERIKTHSFFPTDPEFPREEDLIRDIVSDIKQTLDKR